jgi:methylglutaconyl-CoA hydratase
MENLEDARRTARLFRRIWSFPKPIIGAVNGAALAGGCGLATLCDFTVAVPEATFGYTEVRVGFVPAIVSVFLTRQIGEKRARDLLLTGRIVDAAEAHRLGLVTSIVPADSLMPAAQALASTLIANSPTSLQTTKRLLCDIALAELDRELELAVEESGHIRSTDDFREGLAAFLEKRSPKWTGH